MKLLQHIIFIFSILIYSSCDKQSNPFIGSNSVAYQENLSGESRDVIILEDVEFDVYDCSLLNEEDCISDMWCSYDQSCNSKSNDLLIVANQYEEGLIIYQIIEENNSISLNKIYQNNNFEVLDETSVENDLELRSIVYSEDSNILYILDKFEYLYHGWLPALLEGTTLSYNDFCYDYENLDNIWDPNQFTIFNLISNLHSTQIIMDESNAGNLDESLFLIKYNSNIISQQNLPDPIKTSCSKIGAYYFELDPTILGNSEACNGNFITNYNLDISPLFDYDITDIFFNNDKIFIANPYNKFVFKDPTGNYLNLTDGSDEFENISSGCDLPSNTVYFTNSGELLYNSEDDIGYFELNFNGMDLSDYINNNSDCSGSDLGYYKQYPSNCFEGEISNQNNFAVAVSGNKVIGYSIISSNIESNCGTLIDFNTNENFQLVNNKTNSLSVYDYNSYSNLIDYDYDLETPSKVKSIYNVGDYILTGLYDDGCYITLLGDNTSNLVKLEGTNSFTVNDIYYDELNQVLLLSIGSSGVLMYSWDGLSSYPNFISHIVSSHAYTARIYSNRYVVIATKYGVEIYNYENI
jgi:hypothetical protein